MMCTFINRVANYGLSHDGVYIVPYSSCVEMISTMYSYFTQFALCFNLPLSLFISAAQTVRNQCPCTSTLARSTIFSGVKLYSSSSSAGRKVPMPLTSSLAAANSEAMVIANILV